MQLRNKLRLRQRNSHTLVQTIKLNKTKAYTKFTKVPLAGFELSTDCITFWRLHSTATPHKKKLFPGKGKRATHFAALHRRRILQLCTGDAPPSPCSNGTLQSEVTERLTSPKRKSKDDEIVRVHAKYYHSKKSVFFYAPKYAIHQHGHSDSNTTSCTKDHNSSCPLVIIFYFFLYFANKFLHNKSKS